MPGQTSRSDSANRQFDSRVPSDVIERVRGRVDFISFPAMAGEPERIVKVSFSNRVKVSLRTANPSVADARAALIVAHLAQVYDAARTGPVKLTHEQIGALAGRFYEEIWHRFKGDPGTRPGWTAFKAFTRAAREGRIANAPAIDPACFKSEVRVAKEIFGDDLTAGINAKPPTDNISALEQRFGLIVSWLLSLEGLAIDAESRTMLLKALPSAAIRVAKRLKRVSDFDWSDDPEDRNVFPSHDALPARHQSAVTLTGLLEAAFKERRPTPSTVDQWTKHVSDFVTHVGHDEAAKITKADVVSWKDALFASGLSAGTINKSKLAAIHRAFSWGLKNDKVSKNPAEGVSVDADTDSDMEGFSDLEAETILLAALKSKRDSVRWIPWLCASSGARVGEVGKLKSDDIYMHEGVPVMRLVDTVIGRQKNKNSQRIIPIHPRLIEDGFLEFAAGKKGPLFFDPTRRKAKSKKPSGKIVGNRVAEWVKGLGIKVGREHRKDPNHAWRHLFTTLSREVGASDSVIDIIKGNAPASVSRGYGTATLRHMKSIIDQIKLPAGTETKAAPPPNDTADEEGQSKPMTQKEPLATEAKSAA